jgi:hypothetical protein
MSLDQPSELLDQSSASNDATHKGGRVVGSSNIHSKQQSSIAFRLKMKGFDWIASFGVAIKRNDKQLLSLWLRLLPYLIVTQGHRRVKRLKGKASKAALSALDALERE